MDSNSNNWRPNQGTEPPINPSDLRPNQGTEPPINPSDQRPNQGTEPPNNPSDWRAALPPESRERVVNKIMETLKKHLPVSGPEGLAELQKIAQRFEDKIFNAAESQSDYLRKISLKMLTMESRSQNLNANNVPSNQVGPSNIPPDQGLVSQPQVHNPGQQHPGPIPSQPQTRQQILSHTIPNNVTPQSNLQSVSSLAQTRQQVLPQTIQNNNVAPQSNLPSVSSLSQTPTQNIGQNSNTQNIPGQNSVGSTIGQNSNVQSMFASSQRQMLGRQHVPQQQQQQSQNQQQILYQQQQLLKQKLHMSQMQQKQQQSLMQPNQLQSSQQPVMQTSSVVQPSMKQTSSVGQPSMTSSVVQPSMKQTSSVVQPSMKQTTLSSLPQNQQSNNVQQSTQSMLQQPSQAIRNQQQQSSIAHQQQTVKTQQPMLPAQHQKLTGSQSNVTNVQQHSQMLGQKSNVSNIQQPQRLLSQQNNLMNLQQRQQHLINQQNNVTNIQQQQLGNNVSGLQQQQQQQKQLFGTESGNQGMQTSHHSAHMLQQPKVSMQQQSQQNASNILPSYSQQSQSQSQSQASQQHLMSQTRTQPAQMQQQLGLQKQQQKVQASSGSLHQQQSALDQQKQLYQSQRALPETSTASADSTAQTAQPSEVDWQEEVYQKIQALKKNCFGQLKEFYQMVTMKLQQHQHESNPQHPKSDQYTEKLKGYIVILEHFMAFLQVSKKNVNPSFKEKVVRYEKQIMAFLNANRPRRQQPGQLPPPQMPSMAQSQSQVTPVQSRENQTNSQLQSSNLQSSAATPQQNNIASLQQNSVSSLSTGQHSMLNSMQPGSNLGSGQGSSMNSLQQVPVSSLQQKSVSSPQQTNSNSLPSQGGVNVIQPNPNTLQSGSSMLQHQLKYKQEQQMLQNQPLKQQYQQRHLMQRKQILQQQQQQLNQPAKQQLSAQPHTLQRPQLHQGVGVKSSGFQQNLPAGQHSAYSHQQLKQGGPFPVSSPQLLQSVSPQIPQHSSSQVDQKTHLSSLTKVATPLHSSNSPFVGPTPTPPMPGDSEKAIPGVLSISNAANVGQHTGDAAAPAQSLTCFGTPGISASPLLAELSDPDSGHGNALAATSENSSTEKPIDRLIRAVKSMSTDALNAAVDDIFSVVSLDDMISGSGPGNGSRAALGEDLISITNCRVQTRNSFIQDGCIDGIDGSADGIDGSTDGIRRIRRFIRTRPSNAMLSADSVYDSIMQSSASEVSEQESTATSFNVKKQKVEEVNHALLKEIREINCRLIDTVVGISDEDVDQAAAALVAADGAEGTVVKCSFIPVAVSPTLKSRYASLQSPIQPLRLLVPPNYPNCSPILLDKFPVESSEESEDLYEMTKASFSISLRCLSQPMSVKDIAKTWDKCARGALTEYAQKSGGGTFSSKYGTWKNC